jgi:hypothetical protein
MNSIHRAHGPGWEESVFCLLDVDDDDDATHADHGAQDCEKPNDNPATSTTTATTVSSLFHCDQLGTGDNVDKNEDNNDNAHTSIQSPVTVNQNVATAAIPQDDESIESKTLVASTKSSPSCMESSLNKSTFHQAWKFHASVTSCDSK